jgi:hypothetical protein
MLGGADDADTALVHLTDLLSPEIGSSVMQRRPLGLELLAAEPLGQMKHLWSVSHGLMGGGRGCMYIDR